MGEQGEGGDPGIVRELKRHADYGAIYKGTDWRPSLIRRAAYLIDQMTKALEASVARCPRCHGRGFLVRVGPPADCEASCPDCRRVRDLIEKAKGGQGGG